MRILSDSSVVAMLVVAPAIAGGQTPQTYSLSLKMGARSGR
jgi:hypothetical protein